MYVPRPLNATGGADGMPARPCPTPGGAMAAVLGVLLRNYGPLITDLRIYPPPSPSLPLPRSHAPTRSRASPNQNGRGRSRADPRCWVILLR
jgi:hypothetical protein